MQELFYILKNINSRVSKLFYSSDLGNSENKYFNCGVQLPTKSATVSIYESTYASREKDINCKKLRKQELIELEKTLEHTLLEKKEVCYSRHSHCNVAQLY